MGYMQGDTSTTGEIKGQAPGLSGFIRPRFPQRGWKFTHIRKSPISACLARILRSRTGVENSARKPNSLPSL